MRRAVFLDRDDTLIATREATAASTHPGDLIDPALVRLLPGVAAGCERLREAGLLLIVISNQGLVARGVGTVAEVDAVNRRVRELIEQGGGRIDATYYCPYHPKGIVRPWNVEHPWRKPAPGMLLEAAGDLGLAIPQCWLIGDSPRDREAGVAAGMPVERTVLVGESERFRSFGEAAEWVASQATRETEPA
ncbi:MAG: HAD-IIIA family hydrolase [Phycisphaeraceae bacterium]|nr:HAD-IIIA family hydrolase [Phycisphaeraceae bacterium]